MENNVNNKDLKDPATPNSSPTDEADFWDMDQVLSSTDSTLDSIESESIDLEEIQAELNKEVDIPTVEKPITNLSESELQIPEIDNLEVITALTTEQAKTETASEHDLTEEELEHFKAPVAPIVTIDKNNRSTPFEKIMMTLCFMGLIAFGAYLISYFYDKFDVQTEKEWASNIPVKGEYASITKVETWWTVPQNNNTKFGVKLVPSVKITLGSDSKSGILRAVFYTYEEVSKNEKRAKGDPFPLHFVDGKFIDTGKNTITIYGTDGYTDISSFEYYRTQNEDRWTISLREAAAGETKAENFVELGHAPIEPIRIGTETTDQTAK